MIFGAPLQQAHRDNKANISDLYADFNLFTELNTKKQNIICKMHSFKFLAISFWCLMKYVSYIGAGADTFQNRSLEPRTFVKDLDNLLISLILIDTNHCSVNTVPKCLQQVLTWLRRESSQSHSAMGLTKTTGVPKDLGKGRTLPMHSTQGSGSKHTHTVVKRTVSLACQRAWQVEITMPGMLRLRKRCK